MAQPPQNGTTGRFGDRDSAIRDRNGTGEEVSSSSDRRPPPTDRRSQLRLAAAVFVVWTVLALLSAVQTAIFFRQRGQPIPWGPLLIGRFADWYTCALFTPVFFWLARRLPIDRRSWRLRVPVHLLAAAGAVLLKYVVYVQIQRRFLRVPDASLGRALSANFFYELMIFGAAIGIVHAIVFYQESQQRERLAAELRTRLSEARLDALIGQLRPHFLFNTLHGISTLIHSDPDAADQMLVRLADLLRASLESSTAHEIPLAEELALVERFVDIMLVRLRDRLAVEWRIDPAARQALVPHLLLQPLVENALEHGIARRAGAGRLAIEAHIDDGMLHLTVSDDGSGVRRAAPADRTLDEGIGLGNTRLRLQQLYGDRHRFDIESSPGGTVVRIALPRRVAPVQS